MIKPNIVSRFLSGERDITLSSTDRIAAALGLVLVRADELPAECPAERPEPDRRDYGAMTVWSIETSAGRRAVAIRPAREADDTEYAWVLLLDGNPVDYGDDRAALEATVPEWLEDD